MFDMALTPFSHVDMRHSVVCSVKFDNDSLLFRSQNYQTAADDAGY